MRPMNDLWGGLYGDLFNPALGLIRGQLVWRQENWEQKCWQNLVLEIIRLAAEDYREARRGSLPPEEASEIIRDVESFLLSDWFAILTPLDGERLLKLLKEGI